MQDVVGFIKEHTPVRDYVNDNQQLKKQKKLTIANERLENSFIWTYVHYYDLPNAFTDMY